MVDNAALVNVIYIWIIKN